MSLNNIDPLAGLLGTVEQDNIEDPLSGLFIDPGVEDPKKDDKYGPYGLRTEAGVDIDPNREKTTAEITTKRRVAGDSMDLKLGLDLYTYDTKEYNDAYSVSNVPVEYDDGSRGFISFGEMNEEWNPNLQRQYKEIENEIANLSFEPYTTQKLDKAYTAEDIKFGIAQYEEVEVIPFEKELSDYKKYLTELKQNSLLSPEEAEVKLKELQQNGFTGSQIPTLDTHVPSDFHFDGQEPSDKLLQEYFKHQKRQADRAEARQNEIDRGLALMDEGTQKATKEYASKLKTKAEKNLLQDQENIKAKITDFQTNPEHKKIKEFELNVLNPDYEFVNKNDEEVVELANGKKIPASQWSKYQQDIASFNSQRQAIEQELASIIDRQETIQDTSQELDLLRRNYDLTDKFLFSAVTTAGDLGYGLVELFKGGEWETAQKRRERIAKERETYRPDVKFGGDPFSKGGGKAFDSWSNFGRFLFEETGRQAPIFAAIALSGGTASALGAGTMLSAGVSGATLGLMTGGQQMGDMTFQEYQSMLDGLDYNDVKFTQANKIMTGLGFGAAEGVFGTAPTFILGSRFFSNATKSFINTNKSAILKETGTEYFKKNFLKEFGIGILGEAPSEGLTQITQNALTDRPLLENVGHATFSGGFFGGTLGGGSVALGAAGRQMMNTDQIDKIDADLKELKRLNIELEKTDGRTKAGRELKLQIEEQKKIIENDLVKFEQTWSSKMTKGAYETYKAMLVEQGNIRNKAFEVNQMENLDKESKNKRLEDLAKRYGIIQLQIDKFKDPNFYANKFEGIKVTEKDRYDSIKQQAEKNLTDQGVELNEEKVNKEAYDIYLKQEIDKRRKAGNEVLKNISTKTNKFIFKNDGEAKGRAANELATNKNMSEAEKSFWTDILNSKEGTLNGYAANIDGTYTYIVTDETAIKNERAATESHEIGHIVFWDLLKVNGKDFQPLADLITDHLKKFEPEIYEEMFGEVEGQAGTGRVEKTQDGKFNPMEVVMGLVERADRIDMSKMQNKNFVSYIGNFISGKVNSDAVDLSTTKNVMSFLVEMGRKIQNGTLTQQDIIDANKNEAFKNAISEGKNRSDVENDVKQSAKSDTTLFENTEMLGEGWNNKTEEEKVQIAQTLGLFWENFLNKKIGQRVTVDETEKLALLNRFLGFDTDPSQLKESFGYKRGFIDIVRRWDPAKNNSLAAWIQSANNLPMRILELAKTSKTFGRFEDSIDQQKEGARPIQIESTDTAADVKMDEQQVTSNEFRKLLNIEDNSETYNQVLSNTASVLAKKEIIPLLETNPKKLRQTLKKEFEKTTAKNIKDIIGTQKSEKFKNFITDRNKLQQIINLLGVKYRNRFPMFTTDGGRANVSQSKAMQQSDQGSFVADTKAGNQIWLPKNVDEMSDQEVQEIADQFIQGRETQYKSLVNALANDLNLDAVFTAMEQSPNLEVKYEGVVGKLSEAIKRDPQKAFSQSQYTDIGNLARLVMKNGYDNVYDSPNVLSSKYTKEYDQDVVNTIQEVYDEGLFQDEKVYQFMQAVKRNPLIDEATKKLVKRALTKKSDLSTRQDFAEDMEILANELGSDILNVIGFDALGFINRVLDPAKKKKLTGKPGDFYKFLERLKKNLVKQNDLPIELDISKVRPMNVKINNGLFDRIDRILNNKKGRNYDFSNYNAEQKKAELAKLEDEIREANTHNKILIKHLIKKLVKSKISDANFIRVLQLQTNAAEGLRALTALKYITITDGPIGKLKGEHLADNSGTMTEIVDLRFKNLSDTELDAEIDNIIEFHDQWLENRDKLDTVDVFGKNNPNKDLRIKLLSKADQKNVFTFDMKPAETLINSRASKIKMLKDNKKSKNARGILQQANSKSEPKGISVFDFDDTLAKTKSKIIVTLNGKTFKIDATEFALKSADLEAAGATFDFSEFNKVIDGKKGPLADLALKRQDKFGSKDIFVLTARPQESAYAIHAFLKGIGLEIPIDNITGLADGRPEAKSDWILEKVAQGYNDFYFADDAYKNVKAVQDVLKYIDVKSDVQQAMSKVDLNTFETKINEIIQRQSKVPKDAKYSKLVAKRKGAEKGRFAFLPASMDDFKGMLYYFTGKGEQGSQDLAWLMENINDVYHRAVDAMNVAKTAIIADYKNLNKNYKDISKKINTFIPNTDFTYDQGIRAYIYAKQGMDIPGISKRDLNKLLKAIKGDPKLKEYADQVQIIGSGMDGVYAAPTEAWWAGTILGDLDNLTKKVGRKTYLKDWLDRMEATFTPDVMNKIEAIYGTRFREAFEDVVHRMTTGTNRTTGQNRQVNAWLNWINNSVGTIMFFNRRSALLQSISTINFLNWSDNSPIKAAMAYGNQTQFWKDFAFIWNSPKLKQRRRGLQTDILWQEIANAAKSGKGGIVNRAQAVIAYLLQIGYTPTQLVDNFAIAAGGAPFYRNRINTYKKQGMSQQDAEAKAFEDFSKVAEETQQSGDPALISQEQASVLGRLVLNFQNTPMQMVRLQKKAGMMIYKRQRYPGMSQKQSDLTNIGKIIYYGAIQNFIFTALQNAMFALLPGFDEDDDPNFIKNMQKEDAKKARIINNMIDTILKGSGLKGAVLSTIKNVILRYQSEEKKGFTADHTYTILEAFNISPPIGSKARKIYGAMQTKKFNKEVLGERGFSISEDGKLNLSPMYDIVGNLSSALFNLPLDRVVSELDAVIEMMDQRNATWQRIALGLGWRTWDVGARNEEEELIKILVRARNKARKKEQKKKQKNNDDPLSGLLN